MKTRKSSKNRKIIHDLHTDAAADAAVAADTVAAIGNPPDAAPVALLPLFTPAPVDAAPVDAAPVAPPRAIVGTSVAFAVFAAAVSDAFRLDGQPLNGNPAPHRRDAATFEPLAFVATDAPRLYARARELLTTAVPVSDLDAAAAFYLSNRATETRPIGYFAENRVSDLDRLAYACRAAERLIYTADRVAPGIRPTRRFDGGYNGALPTAMRRASILATLATVLTDGTLPPVPANF